MRELQKSSVLLPTSSLIITIAASPFALSVYISKVFSNFSSRMGYHVHYDTSETDETGIYVVLQTALNRGRVRDVR